MPSSAGFFAEGGPAVRVSLFGVLPTLAQEFVAVIDTGFTGFVSMPMVAAFPLGLVLLGTTNVVLADGRTTVKLTAWGNVSLEAQQISGIFLLDPGSTDVLLGVDWLKRMRKALLVLPGVEQVALADEAEVLRSILHLQAVQPPPSAGPTPPGPSAATAHPTLPEPRESGPGSQEENTPPRGG